MLRKATSASASREHEINTRTQSNKHQTTNTTTPTQHQHNTKQHQTTPNNTKQHQTTPITSTTHIQRLYTTPSIPIQSKQQDDKFDDYEVPQGSDIFISVWNLHRDPSLWERPHEFDPDRWVGGCWVLQ